MVNLCASCFTGTTGVDVAAGDCALIFGMVVDITTDAACECPCHEGHACVMPRRLPGPAPTPPEVMRRVPGSTLGRSRLAPRPENPHPREVA